MCGGGHGSQRGARPGRPLLARAKKANYHFVIGLQRQFEAARVSAQHLTAHPGLSHTDLRSTTVSEGGGGFFGVAGDRVASVIGMSPEVGARPQIRAATDPSARGGELYAPLFVSNGPAVVRPVLERGLAQRITELWELSERETDIGIDVPAMVGR